MPQSSCIAFSPRAPSDRGDLKIPSTIKQQKHFSRCCRRFFVSVPRMKQDILMLHKWENGGTFHLMMTAIKNRVMRFLASGCEEEVGAVCGVR